MTKTLHNLPSALELHSWDYQNWEFWLSQQDSSIQEAFANYHDLDSSEDYSPMQVPDEFQFLEILGGVAGLEEFQEMYCLPIRENGGFGNATFSGSAEKFIGDYEFSDAPTTRISTQHKSPEEAADFVKENFKNAFQGSLDYIDNELLGNIAPDLGSPNQDIPKYYFLLFTAYLQDYIHLGNSKATSRTRSGKYSLNLNPTYIKRGESAMHWALQQYSNLEGTELRNAVKRSVGFFDGILMEALHVKNRGDGFDPSQKLDDLIEKYNGQNIMLQENDTFATIKEPITKFAKKLFQNDTELVGSFAQAEELLTLAPTLLTQRKFVEEGLNELSEVDDFNSMYRFVAQFEGDAQARKYIYEDLFGVEESIVEAAMAEEEQPLMVDDQTWRLAIALGEARESYERSQFWKQVGYTGASIGVGVAAGVLSGGNMAVGAGASMATMAILTKVDCDQIQNRIDVLRAADVSHRIAGLPIDVEDLLILAEMEKDYAVSAGAANIILAGFGGGASALITKYLTGKTLKDLGLRMVAEAGVGGVDGLISALSDDRITNTDFIFTQNKIAMENEDEVTLDQARSQVVTGVLFSVGLGSLIGSSAEGIFGGGLSKLFKSNPSTKNSQEFVRASDGAVLEDPTFLIGVNFESGQVEVKWSDGKVLSEDELEGFSDVFGQGDIFVRAKAAGFFSDDSYPVAMRDLSWSELPFSSDEIENIYAQRLLLDSTDSGAFERAVTRSDDETWQQTASESRSEVASYSPIPESRRLKPSVAHYHGHGAPQPSRRDLENLMAQARLNPGQRISHVIFGWRDDPIAVLNQEVERVLSSSSATFEGQSYRSFVSVEVEFDGENCRVIFGSNESLTEHLSGLRETVVDINLEQSQMPRDELLGISVRPLNSEQSSGLVLASHAALFQDRAVTHLSIDNKNIADYGGNVHPSISDGHVFIVQGTSQTSMPTGSLVMVTRAPVRVGKAQMDGSIQTTSYSAGETVPIDEGDIITLGDAEPFRFRYPFVSDHSLRSAAQYAHPGYEIEVASRFEDVKRTRKKIIGSHPNLHNRPVVVDIVLSPSEVSDRDVWKQKIRKARELFPAHPEVFGFRINTTGNGALISRGEPLYFEANPHFDADVYFPVRSETVQPSDPIDLPAMTFDVSRLDEGVVRVVDREYNPNHAGTFPAVREGGVNDVSEHLEDWSPFGASEPLTDRTVAHMPALATVSAVRSFQGFHVGEKVILIRLRRDELFPDDVRSFPDEGGWEIFAFNTAEGTARIRRENGDGYEEKEVPIERLTTERRALGANSLDQVEIGGTAVLHVRNRERALSGGNLSSRRFHELFEGKFHQTNVGNCFFVAVLKSLTSVPRDFEAIIRRSMVETADGWKMAFPLGTDVATASPEQIVTVSYEDLKSSKNPTFMRRKPKGTGKDFFPDLRTSLFPIGGSDGYKVLEAVLCKITKGDLDGPIDRSVLDDGGFSIEALNKMMGDAVITKRVGSGRASFLDANRRVDAIAYLLDFKSPPDVSTTATISAPKGGVLRKIVNELYPFFTTRGIDPDTGKKRLYTFVHRHAYTIDSVDYDLPQAGEKTKKTIRTVNLINPWNNKKIIKVPLDVYLKAFADIDASELNLRNLLRD